MIIKIKEKTLNWISFFSFSFFLPSIWIVIGFYTGDWYFFFPLIFITGIPMGLLLLFSYKIIKFPIKFIVDKDDVK